MHIRPRTGHHTLHAMHPPRRPDVGLNFLCPDSCLARRSPIFSTPVIRQYPPPGQLPAVEKGNEIGGGPDSHSSPAAAAASPLGGVPSPSARSPPGSALSEFRAAQLCVEFARRRVMDLDQHLTSAQKAELLAYRVMIQVLGGGRG